MQPSPSPRAGDPPGHVKQRAAKALGLEASEIAFQQERLGPSREVRAIITNSSQAR